MVTILLGSAPKKDAQRELGQARELLAIPPEGDQDARRLIHRLHPRTDISTETSPAAGTATGSTTPAASALGTSAPRPRPAAAVPPRRPPGPAQRFSAGRGHHQPGASRPLLPSSAKGSRRSPNSGGNSEVSRDRPFARYSWLVPASSRKRAEFSAGPLTVRPRGQVRRARRRDPGGTAARAQGADPRPRQDPGVRASGVFSRRAALTRGRGTNRSGRARPGTS
jgi:hypothetical protein